MLIPSYILRWKLRDEKGEHWYEHHEEITLSDFEVIYGNNIHEIMWISLRMKGQAMI